MTAYRFEPGELIKLENQLLSRAALGPLTREVLRLAWEHAAAPAPFPQPRPKSGNGIGELRDRVKRERLRRRVARAAQRWARAHTPKPTPRPPYAPGAVTACAGGCI